MSIVATGILEERQDEMTNEQLVDQNIQDSQALTNQCAQNNIVSDGLLKHVDGTDAMSEKGKQPKPLSNRQQDPVQQYLKQLMNAVFTFIQDE